MSGGDRDRALSLRESFGRLLGGVLLGLIRFYQVVLGPLFAGVCRFQPSCSRYAQEAIRIHGPVRGAFLASRRLLRCRPFGGSGLDAVPEPCVRGERS